MRPASYRPKTTFAAMRWDDTDEAREAFAEWFDTLNVMFMTRGSDVELPEGGMAEVGDWIMLCGDDELVAMDDHTFRETFEPAAEMN